MGPSAGAATARPPVLALGGGAGAGKSTLARALAARLPDARIVHLDDCYHVDPALAPSVPRFDGTGHVVDRSAPGSIDRDRVTATLVDQLRADPPLVVVEGMFALALPYLDGWVRWRSYLDVPADVRLARKVLRKLEEGHDVTTVLRGYLVGGRQAHERWVAPSRRRADLVVDGTRDTEHQVSQLLALTSDDGAGPS